MATEGNLNPKVPGVTDIDTLRSGEYQKNEWREVQDEKIDDDITSYG